MKGVALQMPAIGSRFNSWTVQGAGATVGTNRTAACVCDCGTAADVALSALLSDKSKRCRGCGNHTAAQRGVVKHGALRGNRPTLEYATWKGMVERCESPQSPNYQHYGAMGVRIAEEWRGEGGFERFLEAVGPKPTPQHTIDRFPIFDGNYMPGNVRWATPAEQNRNKGDTRLVTIGDRTMCLKDWARDRGLRYDMVHARVRRGWTPERALGIAGGAA